MLRRLYFTIVIIILTSTIQAQSWVVESEDDAFSSVSFLDNGEIDIVAPKGLTLWYKQRMTGNTVIEYESCIVTGSMINKDTPERLSDMNCFWMASEPDGSSVFKNLRKRHGVFVNQYSLRLYYLGYGGNYNSTTRFRRYDGDVRGVDSAKYRPLVLLEYTDSSHLLKPDHWYKIRLEQVDGRVRYYVDGECIVDYLDVNPYTSGYFGFRTTLAHAKLRNFRYHCDNTKEEGVTLKKLKRDSNGPSTFGVPFSKSELNDETILVYNSKGEVIPSDSWTLARWQDGSVKWKAFTVITDNDDSLILRRSKKNTRLSHVEGVFPNVPHFWVTLNNKVCKIHNHEIEYSGNVRQVHKYSGDNFIIRLYCYKGTEKMKMVHTLCVDSALNVSGLSELSVHFKVPLHGKTYERYVCFDSAKMDVQPLIARRKIDLKAMDSVTVCMLTNIAKWNGFRLSQLCPNGYSIRKRTSAFSPWIGNREGTKSDGLVTVGDSVSRVSFRLEDFWQSYPSTLQVDEMCSDSAVVTISLWSPEAESFSFAHYDTISHTLEAAYEDVQPGMSTANGIARTSTIYISYDGDDAYEEPQYVCFPEYFHKKKAFGIWSLPTVCDRRDSIVESTLSGIMRFYQNEIRRNNWYGYWNYGDVMHAYDRSRDEWRYDVGGYAWDNTELGTPSMLWYQFLRTGDADVWDMAKAMTRHCSEVDTYHSGPHAGLGSRHNVTHWGCGAKEARISEAWWNRFLYYLTADERMGDILTEVVDADTLLYHLDPMRLAQPRSLFPCSAPARLRIGPDWLAYVSNWMTQWERTGDLKYRDKIMAGMNSISSFRDGFFTGPLALGYYPSTGVITSESEGLLSTNHLMTIMGGFELVNELEQMIDCPLFYKAWTYHALNYQQMAKKIRNNKFLVPRLTAYGAWRTGDMKSGLKAWSDILNRLPLSGANTIWTNDCATWTLDAIFIKEVIKYYSVTHYIMDNHVVK